MASTQPRILVIKHGALGEFVQATGAFAAIRARHPDAKLYLLTTKPYADMARKSPWFDEVWVDKMPKTWEVAGLLKLRSLLRSVKFDMVYDLQTSERSTGYFHVMGDPPWSGLAADSDYFHAHPDRDKMHPLDRWADQLAVAGIPEVPAPDLSWLEANLDQLHPPKRFVLMVPGASATRPALRWASDRFAALGNMLGLRGISTVVLGTRQDQDAIKVILGNCPTAMSLMDRTPFAAVASLARQALGAVGNDSGPMQLVAAAGCPSLMLLSGESDPAIRVPRGEAVAHLYSDDIAGISVEQAAEALSLREAA